MDRDWKKDKDSIGPIIDDYLDCVDPIQIVLFCEGTRYTEEKYRASIDFAKEKGYEPFKHHLIPKTRGFVAIIKRLMQKGESECLNQVRLTTTIYFLYL